MANSEKYGHSTADNSQCLNLFWVEFVSLKFKFFAANFALPSNDVEEGETPLFSEIIFSDLDREEAIKVVEEYNKVNNLNMGPSGLGLEKQTSENRGDLKYDHFKSTLFQGRISNGLVFKWSDFTYGYGPNHLKTKSFIQISNGCFDKMAAICPDFKWLGFWISDPTSKSGPFATIQNPD